jgi:hypothetical protein
MAGALPRNGGNKSANRVGSTVSRRLRAAGWNISPAARRNLHCGIFVKAMGDYVSILVDTGAEERNAKAAEGIHATVSSWAKASDIEVKEDDGVRWIRFIYGR